MNHPRITIGITCFNAHDTIENAVTSAQNQTWPNTEIIIIDDCSNDTKTPKKLHDIQSQNPDITILHHKENKGVAASRNTIIENANGDFIAFFDDDDQSDPARLQHQYDRITQYEQEFANNNPVICHTTRKQHYPDGTTRIETTMGTNISGLAPHGPAAARRMLIGTPTPNGIGATATCSQMARTEIYKNLNGFDEAFKRSEDTDFNIRAALSNAHFPGIATTLVTQIMTYADDKKLNDEEIYAFMLLSKHQSFIAEQTDYQFCKRWLAAKYAILKGHKTTPLFKFLSLITRNPVLTLQRVFWALPNIELNLRTRAFHDRQQ